MEPETTFLFFYSHPHIILHIHPQERGWFKMHSNEGNLCNLSHTDGWGHCSKGLSRRAQMRGVASVNPWQQTLQARANATRRHEMRSHTSSSSHFRSHFLLMALFSLSSGLAFLWHYRYKLTSFCRPEARKSSKWLATDCWCSSHSFSPFWAPTRVYSTVRPWCTLQKRLELVVFVKMAHADRAKDVTLMWAGAAFMVRGYRLGQRWRAVGAYVPPRPRSSGIIKPLCLIKAGKLHHSDHAGIILKKAEWRLQDWLAWWGLQKMRLKIYLLVFHRPPHLSLWKN